MLSLKQVNSNNGGDGSLMPVTVAVIVVARKIAGALAKYGSIGSSGRDGKSQSETSDEVDGDGKDHEHNDGDDHYHHHHEEEEGDVGDGGFGGDCAGSVMRMPILLN